MGGFVDSAATNVQGRTRVFEYTNNECDHNWRPFVCGQAAVLTAVATLHPEYQDKTVHSLRNLCMDQRYRPDNFGGLAGTSMNRILTMLRERYKVQAAVLQNMDLVKKYAASGWPVIVMTDVARAGWPTAFGIAGHWTVLYGVTRYNYLLSNWSQPGYEHDAESSGGDNVCGKAILEDSMQTWLTRVSGMSGKGILVYG